MNTMVDDRVVEMRFDNEHFEKNVQTSMRTLDKLNESLDLTGASKGLENVSAAAKGLDLSVLGDAAEGVKVKFSALQVMAITALSNITNAAVNAGKRIVSALTIDPIKSGFQEYETQINAVQTILANTSSKGKTLQDVNAALDELNKYADKTIYNFTEMTRNIGTFTAAGVDLDTSVSAIKGIANLAAVSGSTSQQASTAMYQLSQALSSGTVKLQDWNSVVNAGMGGQVFQDALKETARVHGIGIDKMIEKEGSFRETLKNGWLSAEILTETLSKFTGDLTEEQLKTMGYTDEQIKSIIKMGQTANDAATKVKTFTQLFDTLKEAAQSGWTQSWEIIVGDFEEAKELLTEVSDIFGGFINASAEARNEVLQGWKDLGGRTDLIKALRNAFEGVLSIITPVKEAFNEIFPPVTAEQLHAFTEGLKELTSRLKLSETQSANLKSTFKGLFAIVDIGRQALVAVWNVIKPLFGGVTALGNGILGVTGSWGDWIVKLNETIKKTDIFNKILQNFVGIIKNIIAKVKTGLAPVIQSVKEFVTSVAEKLHTKGFELFHGLLERVGARVEETSKAIDGMKSGVAIAVDAMGNALANSKFLKVMFAIFEAVKTITGGIIKAVGELVRGAFDKLADIEFDTLFDLVNTLSVGGIAVAIKKFIDSLSEVRNTGKSFVEGLADIKDAIVDTFGAIQSQLKAGTLQKIATAIAILAASVLVISLIDSDKLAASLAAVGALFAELLTSMSVFGKFGDFDKNTRKSCSMLITMSIAVAILAGAMVKLGSLEWEGVVKGIAAITALSAVVVKSAKMMSSGSGQLVKGASSLVIFAVAIKVLASACEDLGKLDFGSLVKGLIGVGVLMAEVAMFLNLAKFSSKSMSTALGMIALAAAIKILASACADFGAMSVETLIKGLTSIFVVLLELSMFTNLNSGAKNMISIGIAMIAIGAAMKIFASAMADIGSMNPAQIGNALLGMLGVLAEITAFAWVVPNDLTKTAAGLVVVGIALNILASALGKMGGMSMEEIGKGLLAMGVALAEVAIALRFMTGTLPGSAALVVASVALGLLVPVLAMLGAMPIGSIIKGLGAIAGAFGVIGLAAYMLTPIIGPILALAGALTLLGVSVVAAGAGITMIGVGLSAVAVGFTALATSVAGGATAIVAGLTVVITGIIKLIPSILVAVGEGILSLCKVIADGAAVICKAVTTVLKAVIKALTDCIPPLIQCVGLLITELLAFIVSTIPAIVDAALQLIVGLLEAIAENLDDIIEAGIMVIVSFVEGIVGAIPKVVDAGFKMMIDFCNGLAKAIRDNNQMLIDAVNNLMDAVIEAIVAWFGNFVEKGGEIIDNIISGITGEESNILEVIGQQVGKWVEAIKGTVSEWIEAGKAIIDGVIQGIKDKIAECVDAVKDFASDIVDGICDALGIHSPSRVFADIGENTIQGFINGMGSLFSNVGEKAKEIVTNAVTAIGKFPSKFMSAGKTLIGNVVSGFSSKLGAVKEKAGSIISTARTTIGNWASKFKSSGKTLISNVISGFGDKLSSVKSKASSIISTARTAVGDWASKFKTSGKTLISNVVSGFGAKLSAVKEKAIELASSAKTAIGNWYHSFKSTGRNLISGMIKGIGEKANSLVKKAEKVVDDAVEAAKNLLGIHSPSKVFEEMGKFVDEGFIVGLTSFAGRVVKATKDVGGKAINAMSGALSGISDIVTDGLDADPVIRPVLDLSQVQAGSGLLNGLFGQQTVALAGVNAGIIGGNMDTLSSLVAQMEKVNQNRNSEIVGAIATLREDVADLADAITKMKVILDSGTMVGELLPRIDSGLGRMAGHKGRGN